MRRFIIDRDLFHFTGECKKERKVFRRKLVERNDILSLEIAVNHFKLGLRIRCDLDHDLPPVLNIHVDRLTGCPFLPLCSTISSLLLSFEIDPALGFTTQCSSWSKQGKKNSPPLNQRGEEESLFSKIAPGPSMGWKRRHFRRACNPGI